MSKVSIDGSICVGCSLCEQFCPEVFEVGGDGVAHVKAHSCQSHNLQEIVEQCPVTAIKAG